MPQQEWPLAMNAPETQLLSAFGLCSGSEAGSYLKLIDFCITRL